jgi:hypothetical protein
MNSNESNPNFEQSTSPIEKRTDIIIIAIQNINQALGL